MAKDNLRYGVQYEYDICGPIQKIIYDDQGRVLNKSLNDEEKRVLAGYYKKIKNKEDKNNKEITGDYNIFRNYDEQDVETFFQAVEKLQLIDPKNPPKNLVVISELKKRFEAKLKIDGLIENKIEYYSALQSPLDPSSIDCFFKINGKRFTIDIKSSENAKLAASSEEYRAQFILAQPRVMGTFKNDEERQKAIDAETVNEWFFSMIDHIEDDLKKETAQEKVREISVTRDERLGQALERRKRGGGSMTNFR